MRDLAAKFLTDPEKQMVREAVARAEKQTAGEIVVMVVPASYHYPTADILGAAALALPPALALTPPAGALLWLGPHNMWVFLGIFGLLFTGAYFAVRHLPWLKRLFIARRQVEEEVQEAALTHFYQHGLHRTRDETGVLIFVSVLERRVTVLADRGINARLPEDTWQKVVADIVAGIRAGRQAEAICRAVEQVGALLAEHFPVKADDTDELKNLIIEAPGEGGGGQKGQP